MSNFKLSSNLVHHFVWVNLIQLGCDFHHSDIAKNVLPVNFKTVFVFEQVKQSFCCIRDDHRLN